MCRISAEVKSNKSIQRKAKKILRARISKVFRLEFSWNLHEQIKGIKSKRPNGFLEILCALRLGEGNESLCFYQYGVTREQVSSGYIERRR